jgi:hypothetical protein
MGAPETRGAFLFVAIGRDEVTARGMPNCAAFMCGPPTASAGSPAKSSRRRAPTVFAPVENGQIAAEPLSGYPHPHERPTLLTATRRRRRRRIISASTCRAAVTTSFRPARAANGAWDTPSNSRTSSAAKRTWSRAVADMQPARRRAARVRRERRSAACPNALASRRKIGIAARSAERAL